MESIIYYTSGNFSWLQMKLVWEEFDKNPAGNKSKLRLRDIQVRSTSGNIEYQNLISKTLKISVNGTVIGTIGQEEIRLTGGVPTGFLPMKGYDFDANEIATGELSHQLGGKLTVTVAIDFETVDWQYSSPTQKVEVNYHYKGNGTGTIEGSGSAWITNAGKKAFTQAVCGAIAAGAFETTAGDVRAKITDTHLTLDTRLAVTLEAEGLQRPATISTVKLLDGAGNTIAQKADSFSVAADEKLYYFWLINVTAT